MKWKEEKLKADTIKKGRKNIQVAINQAKAAINRRGIDARKAEEERKQQVQMIEAQGGIVPAELTILIHDREKNTSPEDLKSLLAPPDLLQALLILEPTSITGARAGMGNSHSEDTMGDAGEVQIYTNNQQVRSGDGFTRDTGIHIANSEKGDNYDNLSSESDSNSSCTSHDSIARNTDTMVY